MAVPLLCGCLLFALAGVARAATVSLSAQVIQIDHSYTTNGVAGCEDMDILLVGVPSDVVSYSASTVLTGYGEMDFGGPPFSNPITYGDMSYEVPTGDAGWFLAYGGGPGTCTDQTGKFTNTQASGSTGGNTISGQVTNGCGDPVAGVAVTAASGGETYASATTDASGDYSFAVDPSAYTVTASSGQETFSPSAPTVDASAGNATQNFTEQGCDQLAVNVSNPQDNGGAAPAAGQTVPVTITVSAPATNTDTITGVGFTGAPLAWSPSAALSSSDDNDPAAFSLAPGGSQQFTVHLLVAKPPSTATLTSSVTGTSPGGTVTASGTDTITPCSGSNLAVTAVTYQANHDNGARINTPVTIQGTGFCAGMSIEFGNAEAIITPTAAEIAADGKSVTVTVPRQATTGSLTASIGSYSSSLPGTFDVDSFRDTDGFQIVNPNGAVSFSDFASVFRVGTTFTEMVNLCPGLGNCQTPVQVPTASALAVYNAYPHLLGEGICFGWSLEAQRLSEGGDQSVASFDPRASFPWQLSLTPELLDAMQQMQWTQISSQFAAIGAAGTAASGAQFESKVQSALAGGVEAGSNGAIISIYHYYRRSKRWAGHALLAYDLEPEANGGFKIDVADPNQPFFPQENATDGTYHAGRLINSTITVSASGSWSYPDLGWSGGIDDIFVRPYSALIAALHAGLTLNSQGSMFAAIAPQTTLASLTGPNGQPVAINAPSSASGVRFTPPLAGSGVADDSFTGKAGTYTETLTGANPSVLLDDDGLLATLRASAGTDTVRFDRAASKLTVSGSRTATVSLITTTGGQREVTVTGPAASGMSVALTATGVAISGSGHYTAALDAAGAESETQVSVARGSTARVTRFARQVQGIGTRIGSIDVSRRVVKLKLMIPRDRGFLDAEVYAAVIRRRQVVERGHTTILLAGRRTTSIWLPRRPPTGTKLAVTVVTESGGDAPVVVVSHATNG